ncbi:hypothetical protein ONZ45_g5540 [Pleurotus djamor]|nr:hypothetical protein ONZ45_g5540 [Pleurotus djamor]
MVVPHKLRSLALLAVASVAVQAVPANNWDVPCFHGECAYDLPESGQGSGIFAMSGSPKALTDITPAAGWVILDCDPNALKQEIRLVCRDGEEDACNHLSSYGGPVNKVVRLPESCGAGPFARISKMDVADDQGIPDHLAHHVVRRDGATPHVVSLHLDTDFEHLQHSDRGDLNWRFLGVNAKLPLGHFNEPSSELHARSETQSWFDTALVKVAKAVVTLASWVPKNDHFSADANSVNGTYSYNKTVTIFDTHKECSGVKATVKAELSPNIVFTGFVGWNLPIPSSIPITPIDLAGIITVGPVLHLQAYAEADLAISIDTTFTADFTMDLQYVIPSSYKDKVKNVLSQDDGTKPMNNQITLGASGDAVGELNVKAHVVPKLTVGIKAFRHSADIYIQTDIWGGVYIVGKGHAGATATVRPSSKGKSKREQFLIYSREPENALVERSSPVTASASAAAGFSGSVAVSAGIDFTAGAEIVGQFVGFFKALKGLGGDGNVLDKHFTHSKQWTLWTKTYEAGKATSTAAKIEPKPVSKASAPLDCPLTKMSKPAIFEKAVKLLTSGYKETK